MLGKFKTVRQDVFEYISNRLEAGVGINVICSEVEYRFPTFVGFFKTDPEMISEFMEWLVMFGYYLKNREFADEVIPKDGN